MLKKEERRTSNLSVEFSCSTLEKDCLKHSPPGIKSCRESMENDIYSFPQGCLMAGCLNGGSCLFDEGKDAFACSCSPQWRGE